MPDDDTSPEPTGPSGTGGEEAAPESWDTATQATPASDLTQATPASDITRSVPADTTRSMAGITPPTGTPAAAAEAGGARSASQRAWIIALVAVAVLVVAGGIALAATSGSGPKKASHGGGGAPNIPATTTTAQGAVCPLTGLPPTGGAVPQRPALAVKIDNYPAARPQSGLNQADIVFEEPVEGGITRFAAIFQCQSPTLIGPVRSARVVDLQILDQLSKPILIHVGGIDPVLAILRAGNLTDFDLRTHGSVVQNVPGRYAPYDTYISAAAGWGLDPTDTTPPAPIFTYSTTPPAGTPVTSIHIPFAGTNNTLWTWSASSGRWLLSYSGEPATNANDGQISTTNIVVQTVHVTYGPWLENSEGGLEVQSQMTGSGPLTVLRNGVAVTGTWKRASLNDPTTLTASNGSTIALQPGQTWVEIVPSTVTVTTTGPTSSTTTP
jgi:Protein of unknown function (DUF3048) N-terminal domain/Protein of unknown function (DUF3048) C-terminal domain